MIVRVPHLQSHSNNPIKSKKKLKIIVNLQQRTSCLIETLTYFVTSIKENLFFTYSFFLLLYRNFTGITSVSTSIMFTCRLFLDVDVYTVSRKFLSTLDYLMSRFDPPPSSLVSTYVLRDVGTAFSPFKVSTKKKIRPEYI